MEGKNVFKRGLVIGIIILFVGASVIPSICGDYKSKVYLISKKIKENIMGPLDENLVGYWSFIEGEDGIWLSHHLRREAVRTRVQSHAQEAVVPLNGLSQLLSKDQLSVLRFC